MKEVGEALKAFLDNVGYLFGIDFLSFLVSGATCLGAFTFAWVQFTSKNLPISNLKSGLGLVSIAIACYVLGMICFASGRWIRTELLPQACKIVRFRKRKDWDRPKTSELNTEKKDEYFIRQVLADHALLGEEPVKEYLDEYTLSSLPLRMRTMGRGRESRLLNRLYVRMWTEVRQSKHLTASYTLLNRYWFMAATYDGLAMALVVWLIVIIIWFIGIGIKLKFHPSIGITLIIILLFLPFVCWREAERYKQYQVEELVATLAYQRSRRASGEDKTSE